MTVPKFCPARWNARVTTLSALIAKYLSVVKALDTIADCSTGDARNDALANSRLLCDPQFIDVAIVVAQAVLSFFAVVTKTL